MKTIKLTQGKFALVDDADYEWLNQWRWNAGEACGIFYACRHSSRRLGRQQPILMHREVMRLVRGDGKIVDHINNNGLDNRKSNLRLCSSRENIRNALPHKGAILKYRGVGYRRTGNRRWEARIMLEKKRVNLGIYLTEIEAAKVYDQAAIKYFGEFAYLNFPNKEVLVNER